MCLFLRRFPALGALQLFALLCGAMAGAESVHAATLTVSSTADSGPGSLRDAIATAIDGDMIQFDATLNGQTITLTSDELVIDSDITINGPGPNVLTVERASSAENFSIFHVLPGHTVLIEGLTISRGYPPGVFNDRSTLTISSCTVSHNVGGGGVSGGGIYNSGVSATLTITNSTISGNASDFAGGVYNDTGTLTITNSTVSGNTAHLSALAGHGGGIASGGTLIITNSLVSGNTAGIDGGGILGDGMIIITDSTISGNRAGSDGLEFTGIGGGLFVRGTIEIRNTTINGNTARGDGSGVGGGIDNAGQLTIINSTISGNFANQDGGGIRSAADSASSLMITNSTISGNRANRNGGGIIVVSGGSPATLEIGNTILEAGSSGANIFNDGGTITSRGYNLSSDNGGGFLTAAGDQINISPMLSPLQDNGGPTFTHAPLTGSPAINAGDPNFTPPPLFDQRGYDRLFNGRIDIGSLEVQPTPTPTPTATPTATPAATVTPTPSPNPVQALNISTRLRVETGNGVMIGGFIITGNPSATSSGPSGAPKSVALRGIGPSLAGSGLGDVLADPTLELRAANGALIFPNDDWQDNLEQAAQLSALGLAPQDSKESGIVAALAPALYTTILAGKNGGTGIGLVEVYDANPASDSQLANISTRGFVQTGDNVMIGGFILGGSNGNTQVAVRGIGPSLAQAGLSPVLADPTLELRDSNGALLISNDDWQDDLAQAAQLSAHGLAPQDPKESGIFVSLPPGAFTAILAGRNGGTGIGLVEIYNVH